MPQRGAVSDSAMQCDAGRCSVTEDWCVTQGDPVCHWAMQCVKDRCSVQQCSYEALIQIFSPTTHSAGGEHLSPHGWQLHSGDKDTGRLGEGLHLPLSPRPATRTHH